MRYACPRVSNHRWQAYASQPGQGIEYKVCVDMKDYPRKILGHTARPLTRIPSDLNVHIMIA